MKRKISSHRDFFSNLPPEITITILSRNPIKIVLTCKSVCKSWLNLIKNPEFARSHRLSKPAPGLLISKPTKTRKAVKIFEIDQGSSKHRELHHKRLIEIDIKRIFDDSCQIDGSIDGLLFLRNMIRNDDLCICNPITHEFMKLPTPEVIERYPAMATYGFGVSRSSGQYKAVRILQECVRDPNTDSVLSIPTFICQVYTLGTRSWRSIIITPGHELLEFCVSCKGTFLNGNLHWLVKDLKGSWWVSCFDLETEVFTKFQAPVVRSIMFLMDMVVLRDCLCLCDSSSENEIVIHLMSSYEKKTWDKKSVIRKTPDLNGVECYDAIGDGDVLMAWQGFKLFRHHTNRSSTKRTEPIDVFNLNVPGCEPLLYTPSFVSLGDFEAESVRMF